MEFDFVLMRHAYSRHNQQKDQWKQRFGGKTYKTLNEYKLSKFAPELIDSSWIELPNQLPYPIELSKVALVLCSPLRRCLQTCRQLIGEDTGVPVVVEPLLSSRLSAAWSVGSDAQLLEKDYPDFDFSAFKEKEDRWMVELLAHLSRFSLKEMQSQGLSMQEYLLQKVSSGKGQTYNQFFLRTRTLKTRLIELVQQFARFSEQARQVLVIGHSCVLSFLLGRELNQKGKVKDKISFEHCEGMKFTPQRVMSGCGCDL